MKKIILFLLFTFVAQAQQKELEEAIAKTDSQGAAFAVAWNAKKFTVEEKKQLMALAKKATQDRQDEAGYTYIYQDWRQIMHTGALLSGAFISGKYAVDKGIELYDKHTSGQQFNQIEAAQAGYSAQVAACLAYDGLHGLYDLIRRTSATNRVRSAQVVERHVENISTQASSSSSGKDA